MITKRLLLLYIAVITTAIAAFSQKRYEYLVDEKSNYKLYFVRVGTEMTLVGSDCYDADEFQKGSIEIPSAVEVNGKSIPVTEIDMEAGSGYDINHFIYIPLTATQLIIPTSIKRIGELKVTGHVIDQLKIPNSIKAEYYKGYVYLSGCFRQLIFEDGCEVVGGWGGLCSSYLEKVVLPLTYKIFKRAYGFDWKITEYRVPEGCKRFEGFESSTLRTLRLPESLYTENEDGIGGVYRHFLENMPALENLIVDYKRYVQDEGRYGNFFFGFADADHRAPAPEKATLWIPMNSYDHMQQYGGFTRIYEGTPDKIYRMVFDGEEFESTIDGITYTFQISKSDPVEVGSTGNFLCNMLRYVSGKFSETYTLPERLQIPLNKIYYVNGACYNRQYSFYIDKYVNTRDRSECVVFPKNWVSMQDNPVGGVKTIIIGPSTSSLPDWLFYPFSAVRNVYPQCLKPVASGGYVFFNSTYSDGLLLPREGSVKDYVETVGWNSFKHIRGYGSVNPQSWEFYDKNSAHSYHAYKRTNGGYGLGNGHSPGYNKSIILYTANEARAANRQDGWVNLPNSLADGDQNDDGSFFNIDFSSLNDSIFYDDTTLYGITMPAKTDSIGKAAFGGCTGLLHIVFDKKFTGTPPLISEDTFDDSTYANATLWVPVGSREQFAQAAGWRNFARIIEGTYTGVNTIHTGKASIRSYYTLDGRPVNGTPMQKGCYIRSDGKKIIIL